MTSAVLEQSQTEAKQAGKVTLPLASLQAALAKIGPAIPVASCSIPILGNVRIENTEGGTTFTASDLDLSIRATLPRQQEASEAFLLAASRLTGYVKLLEGDTVTISPAKTWATLICGRSKTKLPMDKLANYPLTKFGISVDSLTLSQSLVLRMLHHTTFAVSGEESRYTINGSLLEVSGGKISMVATDWHRLAIYTAPGGSTVAAPALLPMALLKALNKTLVDDETKIVRIADEDPNLYIEIAGDMPISLASRKMTGKFPNWQSVVPTKAEVAVSVGVTDMLASLGRCVAMSDKQSTAVKLTFSPDSLGMKAVDATAGETEESIPATAREDFKAFSVGFNGHYLLDALKWLKGNVTLSFATTDGQSAMKMSSQPAEGETFDYIVMPQRV